jgi:hypothetical protein
LGQTGRASLALHRWVDTSDYAVPGLRSLHDGFTSSNPYEEHAALLEERRHEYQLIDRRRSMRQIIACHSRAECRQPTPISTIPASCRIISDTTHRKWLAYLSHMSRVRPHVYRIVVPSNPRVCRACAPMAALTGAENKWKPP